jgi:hypothetical protein
MAMGTGRKCPVSRGDLLCSKLPSLLEALDEWLSETLLLRRSNELSTFRIPCPELLWEGARDTSDDLNNSGLLTFPTADSELVRP